MTTLTCMHYASNLEDHLAIKSYLGHYANEPMPLADRSACYEADQGWDELFTNYLQVRDEQAAQARRKGGQAATDRQTVVIRRAGATTLDMTARTQRRPGESRETDESLQ